MREPHAYWRGVLLVVVLLTAGFLGLVVLHWLSPPPALPYRLYFPVVTVGSPGGW